MWDLFKSIDNEKKLVEKIKKVLLGILSKQAVEEIQKSIVELDEELLLKGKSYPVGTIREWKGRKYKKVASGKWMRTYSGEGGRGEKQAIANTIRKIQAANSVKELAEIVRENRKRFTNEDGSTHPIVKQFLETAKGKREPKDSDKEVYGKINSLRKEVESLGSELERLSQTEKNKNGGMSDKYYDIQRKFNEKRKEYNNYLDEKSKENRENNKLNNKQPKEPKEERKITSTTYEREQKRNQKQVESLMGNRGAGKVFYPEDKKDEVIKNDKSVQNLVNKAAMIIYGKKEVTQKEKDKLISQMEKVKSEFIGGQRRYEKNVWGLTNLIENLNKLKKTEIKQQSKKDEDKQNDSFGSVPKENVYLYTKAKDQKNFSVSNFAGKQLGNKIYAPSVKPEKYKDFLNAVKETSKENPDIGFEIRGNGGKVYFSTNKERKASERVKEKERKSQYTTGQGVDKVDLSEKGFGKSIPMLKELVNNKYSRRFAAGFHNNPEKNWISMTDGKQFLTLDRTDEEKKKFGDKEKVIGVNQSELDSNYPPIERIVQEQTKDNTANINTSVDNILTDISGIEKQKKAYIEKAIEAAYKQFGEKTDKKKLSSTIKRAINQQSGNDYAMIDPKTGKMESYVNFNSDPKDTFNFQSGQIKKEALKDVGDNVLIDSQKLKTGMNTIKNLRGNVGKLSITQKDIKSPIQINGEGLTYGIMPNEKI